MSQENKSPYFFTPYEFHPNYPLFIFLPGMDETGKELMCLQTEGLEAAFDVRCFVIPADELTSWDDLAEKVVTLTQSELEKAPRSSVYLCGESFGGCIVLKILQKFPQLFTRVILINSGSSFPQVPWLNFGSLLFPLTPEIFYKISSFAALPFLASLNRLSSAGQKALLNSVRSAPKKTANQRLCLLREFKIDETKLSQITQPVLLVASKNDRLLPSEAEAKRLAKVFSNSRVVILPDGGHACLVEEDIRLIQILQAENFLH
ncbi:MAG: alpha/beta hydrolase [Scytonema sp. PMC 1069.18]|nr:alpha/beta hydrolase [Scytonema sp. PMC 1069.18]MEC4880811.1 alpha/beta hydrolase [Scytonema sp. PMC 1070.18]